MSWIKRIKGYTFYTLYLFITVFLLLEIVFQILPVSDSLKVMPVSEGSPILHFQPNRTVVRQIGFDFSHVNEKHINNYGYATDTDFTAGSQLQGRIITVIGDSYVAALEVANPLSFHGLIQKTEDDFVLYPLGMSGSPLSQYVALADYASTKFDPNTFVFVLIDNDFHESWKSVNKAPGFHYFTQDGQLERLDYKPPLIIKLLRQSAFFRYLHIDLKVITQVNLYLSNMFSDDIVLEIALQEKQTDQLELLGFKAADLFLEKIEELSLDKQVVVLIDGDRESIYADKSKRDEGKVFNRWSNKIIHDLKNHNNIQLVDMHPHFAKDWKLHRKKFNYDYDFHWNEHGHMIVAQALIPEIKHK